MTSILTIMSANTQQQQKHSKTILTLTSVGMVVFAIVLPLFLILFNTSYITNSEWLYDYGWWRNDISYKTGLTVDQLNNGADQIKEYFNNDEEFLDLRVRFESTEVSLYKEREILHMVDVKALMQAVFKVSIWSGIFLAILLTTGFFVLKRNIFTALKKSLKWSAIGIGTFILIFGGIALVNFGWLFTQFHFLSFANDLWMLDPRSDYLIIMFPQQFFFEASLFIALLTIIDYMLIAIAIHFANKQLL